VYDIYGRETRQPMRLMEAVATAATYWINHIRPGGYRVSEYLMLAAISALIGGCAPGR
jgi:hypothetical protein